jgi:steroid 5-alpha reductase family enzyme
LIDSYWQLVLIGIGAADGLLMVLYLLQRRTGDATLVDAGWGTAIAVQAGIYGALGPGRVEHRALIASAAGIESLRVAWVVVRRVGHREDSRYRELRERWRSRGREQLSFFVFYHAQAMLAVVLSAPVLLACFNRNHGLEPVEWAGAALWLFAVAAESVADRQLRLFKADPANRGKTMRSGLWRYSRHPNYFFQSLTWIAYGLIAVAAPWGWIGFVSAPLILYLILFVTGIPPSEEQALKRRADYADYQRETSAFVPLPPRKREFLSRA